jgi:hypothetical protein
MISACSGLAELIFEVDGEPVGVTMTPDTINEAAGIRFSPLRLRTGLARIRAVQSVTT